MNNFFVYHYLHFHITVTATRVFIVIISELNAFITESSDNEMTASMRNDVFLMPLSRSN